VFISRVTFEYHYFPATLFLVLALCFVMNDLMERKAAWRLPLYGLTGTAVGLYAAFYPVLIGLTIPTWYCNNFLGWLPSWPF
ncbi:MAG: dolichyl-phosphate-mannose--protein mannosyltransferase, partial [Oscillospiraceae bacterium]